MKDEHGFPRRLVNDDPETAVDLMRRQAEARQASKGKSKRAARQARIDAARTTMRIDIPPALKAHIEKIAAGLGCPASQVVNRLIWDGLEHLTLEQLQLELVETNSMRYQKALPYPGEGKTK